LEAAILKYEKSLFECENEEGSIKRGGREEKGKCIKVGVMCARSGFGGEASQRWTSSDISWLKSLNSVGKTYDKDLAFRINGVYILKSSSSPLIVVITKSSMVQLGDPPTAIEAGGLRTTCESILRPLCTHSRFFIKHVLVLSSLSTVDETSIVEMTSHLESTSSFGHSSHCMAVSDCSLAFLITPYDSEADWTE
jgi:hypothetical protein